MSELFKKFEEYNKETHPRKRQSFPYYDEIKNLSVKEKFISKSYWMHGLYKFDYSLIPDDLKTEKGKYYITCPKHGNFLISLADHKRGIGICKKMQ